MALDFNPNAIADKGYDVVTAKGEASQRQDFVNVLDLYGVKPDSSQMADATAALERQDLLPTLIVQNFDQLDRNGDGTVRYGEMLETYYDPNADTLNKLLAGWAAGSKVSHDAQNADFTRNQAELFASATRPKELDTSHTYSADGTQLATTDQAQITEYQPDRPWPAEYMMPPDMAQAEEAKAADPKAYALSILQNAESTPEAQLKAVQDLVNMGETTATLTDKDGNTMNVRFSAQPIKEGSSKSYVHMYAVDENGKESIVLRALSDGGNIIHQRDKNGNLLDFVGSKWLANHTNSFFDLK